MAAAIAPLQKVPGFRKDLDEPFIARSLTQVYTHPERTFLKAVRKVPPGHYLVVRPHQTTPSATPYWDPSRVKPVSWRSRTDRDEAFRETLQSAVRDRLPDTGTIGIHASGGLDCSSVGILATQILKDSGRGQPVAFSWSPDPADSSVAPYRDAYEYEALQAFQKQTGLKPIHCPLKEGHILELLNRDSTIDPISGGSYGEWPVQIEAEKHDVSVILSGYGGDEFASFGGRGALPHAAMTGRWLTILRYARRSGDSPLKLLASNIIQGFEHALLPEALFRDYAQARIYLKLPRWKCLGMVLHPQLAQRPGFLDAHQSERLSTSGSYLSPAFLERTQALPPWPFQRYRGSRFVQAQLWRQHHLSDRMEAWDNDGRKRGIRYAFPLLDRRVIEFALSLQNDSFDNGEWKRLFFRQAMDPVLPKEICWAHNWPEDARAGAAQTEIIRAFARIGQALRNSTPDSSRASYLDMPRLIRDLDEDRLNQRSGFARLHLALQFLGLENLSV